MFDGGQFELAAPICKAEAEQGDVFSQFVLGYMYEYGLGVSQNSKEAVKWYGESARQGDISSQFVMGYLYENGKVITRDYVQAYMWFNLAAINGDKDAMKNRDALSRNMTPSQIEEAERLSHEWTSGG